MSTDENKRQSTAISSAVNAQGAAKKTKSEQKLTHVYITFECNYPCRNDKWGESSGHETEDTRVVRVFASKRAAIVAAKEESYFDDEEEDFDEDAAYDTRFKAVLFWQEEQPSEWTARRIWVEKQKTYS